MNDVWDYNLIGKRSDGSEVCEVYSDVTKRQIADGLTRPQARLIAAAPTLLRVAQDVHDALALENEGGGWTDLLCELREALAKASR